MANHTFYCPKCNAEIPPSNAECPHCGLIFARYEKSKKENFDLAVQTFDEGEAVKAKLMFEKIAQEFPDLAARANDFIEQIDETAKNRAFDNALEAFNEGSFDTARYRFQKLAELYPEMRAESEMYLKKIANSVGRDLGERAVTYFRKGQFNSAKELFEKIVARHPEQAQSARDYLIQINAKTASSKIQTLEEIAILNACFGVIGAVVIWYMYGKPGVLLGFTLLLSTVTVWGFLRVVCVIASTLLDIRANIGTPDKTGH